MKPLFLIPILLLFSSCVRTQTISKDNTELKFTQTWVWEYKAELKSVEEPEHQGEMVVYFNPEKNYWLFNFESYGMSGEMIEYVIGKPDGTFITLSVDEFGKRSLTEEKIEFIRHSELPSVWIATGGQKYFNENDLGFPKLKAEEFYMKYLKTNEITEVFLADYPIDFLPLYYFNQLNSEAKLPFHFPTNLPSSKAVLEENTTSYRGKTTYKLKSISHTEYFVNLKK